MVGRSIVKPWMVHFQDKVNRWVIGLVAGEFQDLDHWDFDSSKCGTMERRVLDSLSCSVRVPSFLSIPKSVRSFHLTGLCLLQILHFWNYTAVYLHTLRLSPQHYSRYAHIIKILLNHKISPLLLPWLCPPPKNRSHPPSSMISI
jgi:hypothetical protein